MTKSQKKMVLSSDSPINNSGGRLASLWRKILREKNAVDLVDGMIAIQKTSITLDKASKALSNVVANERSAYADTLTFKRFISLIRTLLKINDFDLTITLKPKNGVVSQHTFSFKYDDDEDEIEGGD